MNSGHEQGAGTDRVLRKCVSRKPFVSHIRARLDLKIPKLRLNKMSL